MSPHRPQAIVVLAAGSSRRLGQPKPLLPWGQGSLLQRAVDAARLASPEVWLTLGPHADACWAALRSRDSLRRIDVIDHARGQSASIRAAAAIADALPAIGGLLFLPVDQYRVEADWLRQLLALGERSPDAMVASFHAGLRGAPALFPRHCLPALLALEGDRGARALLRNAAPNQIVDWQAPHAPGDLDTPGDLALLQDHVLKKRLFKQERDL